MSDTHNATVSTDTDPYSSFDTDYAQLESDIDNYNQAVDDYNDACAAYDEQLAAVEAMPTGTEQELEAKLMAEIALILDGGTEMFEKQLNVTAYADDIQGDITMCGSDIQTDTNSDSSVTGDTGAVAWAARDMDKMMEITDPNSTSNDAKTVNAALGDSACSSLYGEYNTMRQDIYWEDDPNGSTYNPTQVADPDGIYTYHFDVNATSSDSPYLRSYGQMYDDMALSGDPDGATEAADIITQACNMNTSTTQSVSASLEAEMTNESNLIQSITSFGTSMLEQEIDLMSYSNSVALSG